MVKFSGDIVVELQGRARVAEVLRRARKAIWLRNFFFLRNKLKVDGLPDGGVRLSEDDVAVWKPVEYLPVNMALKIFLSKLAQLVSVPIQFVVDYGVSGEFSDEQAGAFAEKVLRSVVAPKLDLIKEELLQWVLLADRTLVKIIWDKQGGELIDDPQTGGKTREGDIKFAVLSPFSYLVDPYARGRNVFDFGECDNPARWFQHERLVSLDYLSSRYDIQLKTLEEKCPSYSYLNDIEIEIARAKGIARVGSDGLAGNDLTKIIEHWELPSKRYPEGRLITYIPGTDIVLQDTTLPQPWLRLNRLPVVDLAEIYDPTGFYALTTMENVVPICKAFSELTSKVIDLSLNKVGTTTAYIQGSEKITKKPIDDSLCDYVVNFQAMQPPQIVTYETFPFTLLRTLDNLLADLEMVSGSAEMKYPMRTRTATEIIKAEEMDSTRISIFKRNYVSTMERLGELALEVIKEYYHTGRKIEVVGHFGDIEVISFDKTKLSKKFNISIKAGGLLYSTRYAKLLFLQQLTPMMQLLLSDPENRQHWTKVIGDIISNIMEVTFAEQSSEKSLQTKQAQRENNAFLREQSGGFPESVILNESLDNHDIHIQIHRNFLLANYNNPEFPAPQKSYLKQHINEHGRIKEAQQERLLAMLSGLSGKGGQTNNMLTTGLKQPATFPQIAETTGEQQAGGEYAI